MSTAPGYLALSGTEVANNARTAAYLAAGLGSPQFEVIFGDTCPLLDDLAWPLEVCPSLSAAYADQFYTDPLPTYRVPNSGVLGVPLFRWREAGWWGIIAGSQTGAGVGVLLPDAGEVQQTVRLAFDLITQGSVPRSFYCGKVVNAGTANVGWVGIGLLQNAGAYSLVWERRIPNAGAGSVSSQVLATLGITMTTLLDSRRGYVLDLAFTATAIRARLYGGDPDTGAPLIAEGLYGFDASTTSAWATATGGVSEAAQMAAATEVGIVANTVGFFPSTEVVFTEIDVLPGEPCVATGSSYPSGGAWPGPQVYPALYGAFVNPGVDNAPWVDPAQPASYGYLGLILTDLEGYDTTETRSLDPSASGRGGILGPAILNGRHLKAKGWLIAQDCASMDYGRRWLADALAGELCPGCAGLYADLLPTCGSEDASALRRLYDVGLEELILDTSDALSCCYVTPVTFTLAVADPYVFTAPEVVIDQQVLAPLADDEPPVPFEDWLFGAPTTICVDLADEGLGTDAGIVTLYGGSSGISGGLVYRGTGHYPGASVFPGECVYPADGTPQWDMTICPFVFTISIGPGESFTVDSSRERLEWELSDGTVLSGAPQLALEVGQVVQWIDTCDGEDAQLCVRAFANCSCDDSAAVTVATQHRER